MKIASVSQLNNRQNNNSVNFGKIDYNGLEEAMEKIGLKARLTAVIDGNPGIFNVVKGDKLDLKINNAFPNTIKVKGQDYNTVTIQAGIRVNPEYLKSIDTKLGAAGKIELTDMEIPVVVDDVKGDASFFENPLINTAKSAVQVFQQTIGRLTQGVDILK